MQTMTAREEAQSRQMAFELGYAASPEAPLPSRPVVRHHATDKQFAFIKRLLGERHLSAELSADVAEARALATSRALSSSAASRLIDRLLEAPKSAPAPREVGDAEEPKAGIYDLDGKMLVRVYLGQNSGKMLVKSVDIAEDGSVTYEYQGAASKVFRSIGLARRLPVEEVGRLGLEASTCLICGRGLNDPESVDRGIGPVCAANY